MFSTRIMATSCCCYSFATCCCCCCCCCYELERDLSLDHARRPPILSLASISSLVYTARLRAMQRKECTPRDENQKKRRPLPARRPPPPRSSSFHALKREHAIFFWCELELVISKAKRRSFFGIIIGGGRSFSLFVSLIFFLSFVSLTCLCLSSNTKRTTFCQSSLV